MKVWKQKTVKETKREEDLDFPEIPSDLRRLSQRIALKIILT